MIKTESRALKVAEAILANLSRDPGLVNSDEIPRTTEVILSLDSSPEEFSRQLKALGEQWAASALAEKESRSERVW